MVPRNTSADAGRKGAPSKTKETEGDVMATNREYRGDFAPAYGGGMGETHPIDTEETEDEGGGHD